MNDDYEHASMLEYYWKQRGEVDCFVGHEEALERFPQVKLAFDHVKLAKLAMDAAVDAAISEALREE